MKMMIMLIIYNFNNKKTYTILRTINSKNNNNKINLKKIEIL